MSPAALFAGGLAAGLAAGTASCAAVQGGLLIGLVSPAPAGGLPPVAAFLTGRLAAHTALGALLGLAGAAVQVGPRVRAALLVAAGIVVTVLAVRMLVRRRDATCASPRRGRAPAHGATAGGDPLPPGGDGDAPGRSGHGPACAPAGPGPGLPGTAARGGRAGGASSPGLVRAAGLGAATIFVPCGVTIGMEVVAVSAGSALGGAAALAGLALGTAPAFAALGLLVRGLVSARLTALAGIAALAAGLVTAGSGLRLGGWLPDAGSPAAAAGAASTASTASTGADGVQRLTIWATEKGFRPGIATVSAGRPVEIAFRTMGDQGCTRTIAIEDRDVVLPAAGERVVRLAARAEGRLRYACGMGMYVGFVRFERVP